MARPLKRTVDYFPHFVNAGKTLLILQNEFGNDGYAFWFKLLALLCKTDGQVYDYNNLASWRLLLAETNVSEDIANKILQLLADIEAIDPELYLSKIIWVQNLVDNLADVYTRRRNGFVPSRPVTTASYCLSCGINLSGKRGGAKYCSDNCRQRGKRVTDKRDTKKGLMSTETQIMSTETPVETVIDNINPVNVSRNPQTILDHTILDHTILDHTILDHTKPEDICARFEIFWKAYPKKKSKGQAEKAFRKIKPDEQLLATMLATIERAKKSADWLKESGKYIPYPATWLNARGWEDEISEEARNEEEREPHQWL